MKKVMLLIAVLLTAGVSIASQQQINAELTNAKVFLRGAELTHTVKVKLDKGVFELVFTGIASNINQNSINVSAKGDLIILSVVKRTDYLNTRSKNPMVKSLEDSLEVLKKNYELTQNDIDVLKAEMDLIFANKEIGSKDRGVTVAELQKMAEFYRKRIGEIKTQITGANYGLKTIQKNIDRISNQLNELNNKLNQPEDEIVVEVSSKSANTADFKITYLTFNAGWHPAYDIRVDKINAPAGLSYKANVTQNTGLDWNNINVTLSTRNPNQNNNKPELYPWFIDFQRAVLYKERNAMPKAYGISAPQAAVKMEFDASDSVTMADYFSVTQTQLAAEFVPAVKYSIPSDNKEHLVALQEYSLPARYEYYAAPKIDNNAFLVAYLSDWNEYNLLPGQANIYFENSYVGQTFISPQTVKDTLAVSLGRDNGISVTKKTIKDFSEDKFLSSDIERYFAYDIVIKNNKNVPVKILVEEQLPISKNEDIEVKPINISGGVSANDTGTVKWIIDLDASKSVTKQFVYSVRYPKDKIIPGL